MTFVERGAETQGCMTHRLMKATPILETKEQILLAAGEHLSEEEESKSLPSQFRWTLYQIIC